MKRYRILRGIFCWPYDSRWHHIKEERWSVTTKEVVFDENDLSQMPERWNVKHWIAFKVEHVEMAVLVFDRMAVVIETANPNDKPA